jgi:probable phosphoglycerate mutase
LAFHSPQGRAEITAKIALKGLANSLPDPRIAEISFGDWEGRTRLDVHGFATSSDTQSDANFHSPNGETFEMISSRVHSFLEMLSEPTIIVTHGTTSSILRGAVLGLDLQGLLALPLEQGCVFHLSKGIETILRTNES